MPAEIAQLGERQTEDLKVPGSNPEGSQMSSEQSRVSAEFCFVPFSVFQ